MTMMEKSFMVVVMLLLMVLLLLLMVTKYLSGSSVFSHCSAFTLNLEWESWCLSPSSILKQKSLKHS